MRLSLSQWWKQVEIRVCSAVSTILFLTTATSFILLAEPAFRYVTTRIHLEDEPCVVVSTEWVSRLYLVDECSCSDSCTENEGLCVHVIANASGSNNLSLTAGVLDCGLTVDCAEFVKIYRPGKEVKCQSFLKKDKIVVSPVTSHSTVVFMVITTLPLALLIACTAYVVVSGIFNRAYPDKTKEIAKPRPKGPKSFYERKLLELERLRQERLERERIAAYADPVKVEELTTVTALVFKPNPSWIGSCSTGISVAPTEQANPQESEEF